ncbi:H+/gluconate symporter-like permease [Anaerospora hongkongensis]|uniref:H+/gluconate symporter-like permease n=1 Tax=Anaerospora hongkongensis TaxID=244830 RepID=A0A4R1PV38_9FIRM|nr:GntP family permease [Anaerospora hongkongensis]TCL35163.1 H+/gluconate symporter-like permease [Anaerospora hongkongensis]
MQEIGIILSLFLLMFFAYRGFSVILFAPVFALLAASMSGLPLMPAYTELFMAKGVTYIKSYFPIFLLGAVFGKTMEDTGLAKGISRAIIRSLGKDRAILSVVLAGAVLTYGGVSLFVVVFAVYPFAAALFREADIPKRLVPGSVALGAFTFTMDSFPGTPQIQNIIPTNYFGTTIYAAPISGILGGLTILILGVSWMEHRRRSAAAAGEGYGKHTLNEPEAEQSTTDLPAWYIGALPLLAVLVVNFFLNNMFTWNPATLQPFQAMNLPLVAPAVKNVISSWSLIIALVIGILLTILLGWSRLPGGGLAKSLNAGAIGSLLAIMNTASEVGYGNVIASLPGFKAISGALMSIKIGGSPLVSEAVTVNVLAGVTGSASGGLSIALDLLAKDWLTWANTIGMSPQILHRVASMASGGMDTLPHNGAVITLLAVCGMTHRDSYGDIFAMTVIKTSTVFLVILFHSITGLL